MRIPLWLAILGLAFSSLPLVSHAWDDSPDVQFYTKAAQSNLAEIDGGMLARQRSTTAAVTSFADMMVKDHTAANAKLRGLAMANHVDLPAQPSPEQVTKQATLKTLNGTAFDKAYIEWQILQHRDAIALFKEESASGDDVDARRFASDTLPILQSHLAGLMAMPAIPLSPP